METQRKTVEEYLQLRYSNLNDTNITRLAELLGDGRFEEIIPGDGDPFCHIVRGFTDKSDYIENIKLDMPDRYIKFQIDNISATEFMSRGDKITNFTIRCLATLTYHEFTEQYDVWNVIDDCLITMLNEKIILAIHNLLFYNNNIKASIVTS